MSSTLNLILELYSNLLLNLKKENKQEINYTSIEGEQLWKIKELCYGKGLPIEKIKTKTQFIEELENSLLSSLYGDAVFVKERAETAKVIIDELKKNNKEMTITDLKNSNSILDECSNQRLSTILKTLADNGMVNKEITEKKFIIVLAQIIMILKMKVMKVC